MSRTWLLRGAAVAVCGVLVGAWTGGLIGTGDTAPPASKPNDVASSERSAAPDNEESARFEQGKLRRPRDGGASRAARAEPSTDATETPTDDAPATSDPTSDAPTSDQPSPSEEPSDKPSDKPSDSPSPSAPSPSSPPTQPSEECTDLGDVLDCMLNPITGGP